MLLIVAAILFVLWALGLLGHIGGGLINILVVIALVTVIVHFLTAGRNRA